MTITTAIRYDIRNLANETLITKDADQMKDWIKKYNVTDKNGKRLDLRNAKGGVVARANGKLIRIYMRRIATIAE